MALTDSLIAYWPLSEASGNRVDVVGGNDLTDINTVTSATGKLGDAATFVRANTEYLIIGDNAAVSTGNIDFSFTCWVKIGTLASGSCVLSKESDNNNREYRLEVFGGVFRWITFQSSGAICGIVSHGLSVSAGVWYFLHVSRTSGTVSIAVNNGTPVTASETGVVSDTTADFRIGLYDDGSILAANYWDGLIDDVSFWKRLLTGPELTQLYNSGDGFAYPFSAATVRRQQRSQQNII